MIVKEGFKTYFVPETAQARFSQRDLKHLAGSNSESFVGLFLLIGTPVAAIITTGLTIATGVLISAIPIVIWCVLLVLVATIEIRSDLRIDRILRDSCISIPGSAVGELIEVCRELDFNLYAQLQPDRNGKMTPLGAELRSHITLFLTSITMLTGAIDEVKQAGGQGGKFSQQLQCGVKLAEEIVAVRIENLALDLAILHEEWHRREKIALLEQLAITASL